MSSTLTDRPAAPSRTAAVLATLEAAVATLVGIVLGTVVALALAVIGVPMGVTVAASVTLWATVNGLGPLRRRR